MSGKKRMAGLELLRCVAMMMVIVLHYLGKGNLLPKLTEGELDAVGAAAWLLESFCIVAVNVYMLISGYFLCTSSFKLSRLLQLLLQVWLYSVTFGILGAATGVIAETPVDTHYFLTLLFPISMEHYWFMTAYVFLYLLLPFAGAGIKRMTKRQMQLALMLLLITFCGLKSLLPVQFEKDVMGYDCLWYLCVFVTAAYIRRFGVPFLEKRRRAAALYIACCLLAFAGTMALQFVFLRTGRLGRRIGMFIEYNHVLVLLAAVGLFGFFAKTEIKGKIAHVINKVGPYTLGVYLLHQNLGLCHSWQNWLGADRISNVGGLLLGTLLAVSVVFVCGILADMLRAGLMKGLHSLLCRVKAYRKLVERIEKADSIFREAS
ncbi:MAG: acyltransferase [Butyrivibrio sp.]|nr:acyltransferase [Acetatifactor muris]MCM1559035.1 acyltransferase [Butyrivibrio sp.]